MAACCYRWSSVVCVLVCLSVMITSPAKMAELIKMPFELWTWVGWPKEGVQILPMWSRNFEGERDGPLQSIGSLCHELCKSGWTDRDAVWDMDLGGPKKACVRWGCTLAPPSEYHWTVHVRRRCHLFAKLCWPLVPYWDFPYCLGLPAYLCCILT